MSTRAHFSRRLSALALAATVLATFAIDAGAASGPSKWREQDYNPQPLRDDVILPMACGGAMVFRKIEVPRNSDLGDRRIVIGDGTAKREVHLSGTFPGEKGWATSHYYLAKYELTEAQYKVALAEPEPSSCPAISQEEILTPKGNLTRTSARMAAESYSAWLARNNSPSVPMAGRHKAFARLPTEAEWEFAARGGHMVNESEYQHPALPPGKTLEHFARFDNGANISEERVIGSRAPNRLGLHDMLGNQAEIMEDGYSPISGGRLLGMTGGAIIKGGGYRDEADILRAKDSRTGVSQFLYGLRHELKSFDEFGQPGSRADVGTRFALAAIIHNSEERAAKFNAPPIETPEVNGETWNIFKYKITELLAGKAHLLLTDADLLQDSWESSRRSFMKAALLSSAYLSRAEGALNRGKIFINQLDWCMKQRGSAAVQDCIQQKDLLILKNIITREIDAIGPLIATNRELILTLTAGEVDSQIYNILNTSNNSDMMRRDLCSPDRVGEDLLRRLTSCQGNSRR